MALTQEQVNSFREKYNITAPTEPSVTETPEVKLTGNALIERLRASKVSSEPVRSLPQQRDDQVLENIEQRNESGVEKFSKGVAKSGLRAAEGLFQVGKGVADFVNPTTGTSNNLLGDRLTEEAATTREGEGGGVLTGDIAQFALPGAAAARATRLSSLPVKLGSRALTSGTVATAQSGEVGKETAIATGAEIALPLAGKYVVKPVVTALSKYSSGALKNIAGFLSGKGRDAVDRVFANPNDALKGMNGDEVKVLSGMGREVRQAVKEIKQEAGSIFSRTVKEGNTKTKSIPMKPLKTKLFSQLEEALDIKRLPNGKLKIENTALTSAEESQISKILNKVTLWSDNTPEGINKLATGINKFRRGGEDTKFFDLIVDNLRRTTRSYVGEAVPEIAKANSTYAAVMNQMDDVANILKTSGPVSDEKGIRKTAEAMQLMFGSRKELQRKAIDEVGLSKLLSKESGRQFQDEAPRSLASIGDFASKAISTLIPPKFIGRTAAGLGKFNNWKTKVSKRLSTEDAATNSYIVGILNELFDED